MKSKKYFISHIVVPFILAVILSTVLSVKFIQSEVKIPGFFKQKSGVKAYTGSQVDPYMLLTLIQKNNQDIVIIDLRSEKEYNEGHIKKAVNIALYEDIKTYIAGEYPEGFLIDVKNKVKDKKTVIMYGHSAYSQFTYETVQYLHSKGIKAQSLGVGWNEWRHFRNVWLPESEWGTIQIDEYIEEN